MKILVTGGCGYIGSHTIIDLLGKGFEVICADNYINSDASVLERIHKVTGQTVQNYDCNLEDVKAVEQIFEDHSDIKGIIHFAALKAVGESVERPLWYYRNNINSLLSILECMEKYKVPHLIFSSSCSIYGNIEKLPATEETPIQRAESPYARTKQMCEDIILDAQKAFEFNAILLRYFNPAGAHISGLIGELPINPPLNLVPVIMETAIGKRSKIMVFGDDYPTRDGSCIRDYIHIEDLADAHTKAMEYLNENRNEASCEVFNLGSGIGVSVLEAIDAFEKSTGQKLNYEIGGRRAGDVIAIYADYSKSTQLLGWEPKRSIQDIMKSAWAWEQVK